MLLKLSDLVPDKDPPEPLGDPPERGRDGNILMRISACHPPYRNFLVLAIVGTVGIHSLAGAQTPLTSAFPTVRSAECIAATAPAAEALAERATGLFVARGYANVAAVARGHCVFVTYENARYRDERRALRTAGELLAPLLAEGLYVVLVPTHRFIPLVTAHLAGPRAAGDADPDSVRETRRVANVSLDVSVVPRELLDAPRASSSLGRMDMVVHPWFQAVFGDYDNPVASRTGVAPELRMDVRPGLSVSAQALVTLQDDLPTGESRVRPGLVTVNQRARLPRNVFVSATAGLFNPDRYGADVETRAYFAGGRLSAGAQFGMTGRASYASEGWDRTPMRDETALVDVAWHIHPYDLLLRATGGAFLEAERGVRVDVARRFGELEIGWFLIASEEGKNGGLVLRIPLLPATYGRPAPLRMRTTETYRWQYRYHGFVPSGWRYDTGNSILGPRNRVMEMADVNIQCDRCEFND